MSAENRQRDDDVRGAIDALADRVDTLASMVRETAHRAFPKEMCYSCHVAHGADDNVFTNLMAARNLLVAAEACTRHPDQASALGASTEETAAWRDAAAAVHVPYDEERGVHSQSAGFTRYAEWDFELWRGRYPLMMHAPYVQLYRKQVVKQADLVLAMHWCSDRFTPEQNASNVDYYEQRTVRDSSVSACTQSVLCDEVGHLIWRTTTSQRLPLSTCAIVTRTPATDSTWPRSRGPGSPSARASGAAPRRRAAPPRPAAAHHPHRAGLPTSLARPTSAGRGPSRQRGVLARRSRDAAGRRRRTARPDRSPKAQGPAVATS